MSVAPAGFNITGNAGKIVFFMSMRPSGDFVQYIGSLYAFGIDEDGKRVYIASPITTPEIVGDTIECAAYNGYYDGGVGCTALVDVAAKTVEVKVLATDGSLLWHKILNPNGQFFVKTATVPVVTAAAPAFGLAPSVALVGTTDTQEASA
jgi:hypothetical protein